MNKAELYNRLQGAYLTCSSCGNLYGLPRAGASTMHYGVCDVCDRAAPVTEARDYGYFHTTIRRLREELGR